MKPDYHKSQRIHFIAIGGSAMHNLAIALHLKGCEVTGSDDEIFEPSKSRLAKYDLLPETNGWDPGKIHNRLDSVILGMHAKKDNPELQKAKEIGLKIFSYPEYLYEHAKEKTRIVIGGSHGKTTITAMILHVLHHHNKIFDFMVGAQLEGFEVMVQLSDEADIMILEGDEYLTSPEDPRPKFHVYKPDIGLISGIAWDHINVFPTYKSYVEQFIKFIHLIPEKGILIYCSEDKEVVRIAKNTQKEITSISYGIPEHIIENGITILINDNEKIPISVFGKHNLMNLNAARKVCNQLQISDKDFSTAISSFKGASKRLELMKRNDNTAFYKDFAHSPSKVKATIAALKEQYPERKLISCLELHTYSSLNKSFLSEYQGSMNNADIAIVYFNTHTIALKRLPEISIQDIEMAFGIKELKVFTSSEKLKSFLFDMKWNDKNLLMMSSGNFDGIDLNQLTNQII